MGLRAQLPDSRGDAGHGCRVDLVLATSLRHRPDCQSSRRYGGRIFADRCDEIPGDSLEESTGSLAELTSTWVDEVQSEGGRTERFL